MCSDTSRGSSYICEYPDCSRPVWQDPDGSYPSYCGNGHRIAMAQQGASQLCQNCHSRPVYIENGYAHDFCGKRCATAYKTGQQRVVTTHGSPTTTVAANQTCRLAGCKSPVFRSDNGTSSQFCSRGHSREAVTTGKAEACMLCLDMPKAVHNGRESDFCSKRCCDMVFSSAPIILEVSKSHKAFQNVETQFMDGWKHSTPKPQVLKIWKIFEGKKTADKFAKYKLAVERSRGLANGNTRRRWHGTIRTCELGDKSNDRATCDLNDCSLCGIIDSSFQIAQAGSRTNFGRFGAGIYTSATSSKANDYVSEGKSSYKSMLLNNVILGKTIKLTTNNEKLTKPPSGYDAVVGEPGGNLNYDESIVYVNDAIRPAFLVIYK